LSALSWLILIAATAASIGFAYWIYQTREVIVPGIRVLTTLRASALALVALLLLNPTVPWGASSPAGSWTLLDASLSMMAGEGRTAWDVALDETSALARAGSRIVAFGERTGTTNLDELGARGASQVASRLTPAIEIAAEAGATAVTVMSDLRIEDLDRALGTASALGLEVAFLPLGGPTRNVGVAEVGIPELVTVGDTLDVEVRLFGEGGRSGDSVDVEVREDGRLIGVARASLPAQGALSSVRMRLPAPSSGDEQTRVRYTIRALLEGDLFPEDDERVRYVLVGGEEGGIALISFRPDFEPRYLAPVLGDATGLDVAAFLSIGGGRYLQSQGPAGDDRIVDDTSVRARASSAELVVLHGLATDVPPWALEVASRVPRVLVLPSDPGGVAPLGVTTQAPIGGEWYAEPGIPASPLAAALSGVGFEGLAPLTSVFPIDQPPDALVPLRIVRQGTAISQPALLLGQDGGRRWAVSLAEGFWRWGFREGRSSEAYRRLWSSVGGWLFGNTRIPTGEGVRPEARVVERGQPLSWLAPSMDGVELRIVLSADDSTVADTVVSVGATERARTGVLPPGRYGYRATRTDDGQVVGEGTLDVSRFTDELDKPVLDPEAVGARSGATGVVRIVGGRRLRTSPLPYLAIIALLLAEWIGRRRQGLR
jgi:hypothetical protein